VPVIASQTIHIDVKEDKSVTVLLLKEFKKNKCIHLPSLSSDQDEMDKIRDTVKQLVGEKVIECDKDTCCISNTYFNFVDKIKKL
jgi:hypothetical protein